MATGHKSILGLILIATLSIAVGPARAADPESKDIDAIFADYNTTTSPGCSLGVIRHGEMIYKRGYGMANLEYGIALSPRSVFRTGSVGKQFTAMAIAILAEQGTISLDDPLKKLFPEFPVWAETVTIRHLVHHTSGVRDYLTLTWLTGMGDDDYFTDDFALDLLSRQQNLNFEPGSDYLYSNSGYLLLAHIVKRSTGKPLREWAAENMFGPLGMRDTHFHDDHNHIVPNRASGYAPTTDGFRINMTTLDMVGDGGIYTTVEDLLLWDRNFYDNKLSKAGPALIETVTTSGELSTDEEMTYAFGLDVEDHRGLRRVSHGGSWVGFRAYSTRYPDQRLSAYVLCNRADANPEERGEKVIELFLADVLEPPTDASDSTAGDSLTAIELDRSVAEGLTGHYRNDERLTFMEIVLDEGILVLVPHPEERYELTPLAEDHLALVTAWAIADLTFSDGSDGARKLVYSTRGGKRALTYSRFEPRTLSDAELEAYTGSYFSDELNVEYVLQVVDGSLTFEIDRKGKHPLNPKLGETFDSPDYGTFTFQTDADGKASGFTLDAGRVTDLQFVKR